MKRLDVEKTEVKTSYCISKDQREYQMRIATSRIKERLVPYEMQMREDAQAWAKELPGLPQRLYEKLAKVSSDEFGATQKGQLQELCRRVLEEGETPEKAMRAVWGEKLADASPGLQQALRSSLALPDTSHGIALKDEPIAIICYGPSLKKTWPMVKNFKNIMTCSGAHDFLIEREIIPTWHVDLDPREHKVKMLTPRKDIEYLMASCCHPTMWDKLEGYKVKLWHIYSNEANKDLPLTYPRGEWVYTGGQNVGMRCLVIARVLGFRDFHLFGMDCSFPKNSAHHAGNHLNASQRIYETPYEGKMYYCEPVMLDYARAFFHEVEQLPDVTIKLYGEGLLQHMASKKAKDIKNKKNAVIAFSAPVTISPEHTELMKKKHLNPVYGIDGKKRSTVVLELAEKLNTRSILDYGCGKGTLGAVLPFPIWEYDPAIPGKDGVPRPADIVICDHVLECVEPEMLENVLGDLARCSKKMVLAVIESKDRDGWNKKLDRYFKIAAILQTDEDLHCVLEPRPFEPLS